MRPLLFFQLTFLLVMGLGSNLISSPDKYSGQLVSTPSHTATDNISKNIAVNRDDSLALVALYHASAWQQWETRTGWLQAPVRDWFGVTVVDGRVTRLELPENNLRLAAEVNSIPPEIGNLSFLRVLDLQKNRMLGAVPAEIANLTRLEELYLNDNSLTALPNLGGTGNALNIVSVENNFMTFEDLEPNVGQGFVFNYAPQGVFNLPASPSSAYEGQQLTLNANIGGTQNQYQWYLQGIALEGATNDRYTILEVTSANTGPYEVEVLSPLVPELILRSNPKNHTFVKEFEQQWLDIGAYHNVYAASGGRRDRGGDAEGMEYPAILRNSEHLRYKAFWIGVKDWTDSDGWRYPYYVAREGGRIDNERPNSVFSYPVQNKLIGRYEDTVVEVNGAHSFDHYATLDEIDPSLPADRMIHNIHNMAMGITVDRKIYAYTNEYHDNYHIIDYEYCNTGNIDEDEEIELPDQTLHDVIFFRSHSWRGSKQGAYATASAQAWGRYTVIDVVGDGNEEYPVDFTAQYAWIGWNIEGYRKDYEDLGGPLFVDNHETVARGDTFGRLSGATMVGRSTIHADRSTTDPSYDQGQPTTMGYLSNDATIYSDGLPHETYYRTGIIPALLGFEESNCIPCRRLHPHFADINQPDGEFWKKTQESIRLTGATAGGYAATAGYGPYEMAPGECISVTVSEGIDGLSFDAATKIGQAFKQNGLDRDTQVISYDANSDNLIDSTAFDYNRVFAGTELQTKNQWVMSARDSLYQTFYRARDVYEASQIMTVYPMAEPPRPPARFSLYSRPDAIDLEWVPASSGPSVDHWELFRTENRVDNLYVNGCLENPEIACGYELIAMLPATTTSYTDTDVSRAIDYYYYVQAVGEAQMIAPDAVVGTPGGTPLRSSRYLTQSYTPISPGDEIVEEVTTLPDRITHTGNFPNPFTEETRIQYLISASTDVKLVVYDILGREVETLVNEFQGAGFHEVVFTPTGLANGVYIYVLQAGKLRTERKMLLMR